MKKHFSICAMILCINLMASAQEYLWEIGGGGGLACYMGDLNELNFYNHPQGLGSVCLRYTPTLRSAIKGTVSVCGLKSEISSSSIRYPQSLVRAFQSTLCELGIMYEFNFFNYGDAAAYQQAKRFSPYLTIGLGFMANFPKEGHNVFSAALPVGIGVKFKVLPRLNIGLEWGFRWAFTDGMEGGEGEDPYEIGTSGLKNRDCYSFTTIFVTYNFHERKRICNSIYSR